MTDNEIIKALEHCKGYLTNDCAICQNVEKYPRCNEFLNEIALDLINRQKAEIERLREIANPKCQKCVSRTIECAKSEAIKEFAEKLKRESLTKFDWNDYVDVDDIDNLVKEMTEVEK